MLERSKGEENRRIRSWGIEIKAQFDQGEKKSKRELSRNKAAANNRGRLSSFGGDELWCGEERKNRKRTMIAWNSK